MRQPMTRRTFLTASAGLFGALVSLLIPTRSSAATTPHSPAPSPAAADALTPSTHSTTYTYECKDPLTSLTVSYYDLEGNYIYSYDSGPSYTSWEAP